MIAVLGAAGQLGSAFARLLEEEALLVTRDELDLNEQDRIEAWIRTMAPEVVLNCAAFTAVDDAENDPRLAQRINSDAVGILAQSTADVGAHFVTFSTDYVFDGTKGSPYLESDTPNPLNVYGATKLHGEQLAAEHNPSALIIRTSWVMSGTHPNFVRTILRLLQDGSVQVVDDQKGRPTFVDDLVVAVMQAVSVRTTGLLHLSNQGETTWHGLAQEIAETAGYDPSAVRPITTEESGRQARRPADSRLDSERVLAEGLTPLPHYRQSLQAAIDDILSLER